MLSAYPACFYKEESGYSVIFPDFNDLATSGGTLEEAFAMAIDCMAGYLFWLKLDGETEPEPSNIDDIDPNQIAEDLEFHYEIAFTNMVTVDVEDYAKKHFEKAVKKTLTIPSWLNKAAMERDINFSKVLQEALKEKLDLKVN
ncbi:MAG: type II toxin-antitoxin system HicB family antitoxin [Firmicutes bacterium]|nr:type II toxin-antitoxin system HicB family antitoxin [Bacillota bacterium]